MRKYNFLYMMLMVGFIGYQANILSMIQSVGRQNLPLDATLQVVINTTKPVVDNLVNTLSPIAQYVATGFNNNKVIILCSLVAGVGVYTTQTDVSLPLQILNITGTVGTLLPIQNQIVHHVLYEHDFGQASKISLIALAGAYTGFKIASMTHDEYLAYINPPAPVIRKR